MPKVPVGLSRFISKFTSPTILANTWMVVQILFFLAVIGVIAYLLIKYLKFNRDVIIYKRRGNNLVKCHDKGKVITRSDGSKAFYLLKHRVFLPPPSYEHLMLNSRGKATIHYLMYDEECFSPTVVSIKEKDVKDEETKTGFINAIKTIGLLNKKLIPTKSAFKPIPVRDILEKKIPELEFKPIDVDMKNWGVQESKRSARKISKLSTFEKYQQVISVSILFVLIITALWISMSRISEIARSIPKEINVKVAGGGNCPSCPKCPEIKPAPLPPELTQEIPPAQPPS